MWLSVQKVQPRVTHNIFKALKDERARVKVLIPHCGACRGQVTGNPKVDSTSNLMAAASSAGVRAKQEHVEGDCRGRTFAAYTVGRGPVAGKKSVANFSKATSKRTSAPSSSAG